jgi:hypothetical protein
MWMSPWNLGSLEHLGQRCLIISDCALGFRCSVPEIPSPLAAGQQVPQQLEAAEDKKHAADLVGMFVTGF